MTGILVEAPRGRGTVLVLAVAPLGRWGLMDVSSVPRVWAHADPRGLVDGHQGTVIDMFDPVEPRAVLDRISAAAQSGVPLTLVVAGQLHGDRKTRELFLALALSTPRTVRQTAVSWRGLVSAVEAAAGVTVLVDLVVDASAWRTLQQFPLSLGSNAFMRGRVTRAGRGRVAAPEFVSACLALWQKTGFLEPAELHRLALVYARGEDALLVSTEPALADGAPPGGVGSSGDTPRPEEPGSRASGSLRAVLLAAREGRHEQASEAAAAMYAQVARDLGRLAPETLLWMEVCAEVARMAMDPVRSCAGWLAVARARLERGEPCDAAEVEACVDRAHHQWQRIGSTAALVRLAPQMIELRRLVPGQRSGSLADIQRRTERVRRLDVLSVRPSSNPESAILRLSF